MDSHPLAGLTRDPELIDLRMAAVGFWSAVKITTGWFVASAIQLVACGEAISYMAFVFQTGVW